MMYVDNNRQSWREVALLFADQCFPTAPAEGWMTRNPGLGHPGRILVRELVRRWIWWAIACGALVMCVVCATIAYFITSDVHSSMSSLTAWRYVSFDAAFAMAVVGFVTAFGAVHAVTRFDGKGNRRRFFRAESFVSLLNGVAEASGVGIASLPTNQDAWAAFVDQLLLARMLESVAARTAAAHAIGSLKGGLESSLHQIDGRFKTLFGALCGLGAASKVDEARLCAAYTSRALKLLKEGELATETAARASLTGTCG